MPLVHDRCICLFKTEYSETSQVLTLFSREHGIIRAIAKGAHRRTKAGASRFDGGLDLLEIGQAVFTHDPARELATLTEWHLVEGNLHLRRNLRSMHLGLYAAELVAQLIEEHDAHPDLFDRLEAILADLASNRREEAFLDFELNLLRKTGYMPEYFECVACSTPAVDWPFAWFSPARGGVICRNCEAALPDRLELDVRLLRLLQSILRLPRDNGKAPRLPQLTRHQTDPLNRLLADHVEHTLSRPMRMRGYILPRPVQR